MDVSIEKLVSQIKSCIPRSTNVHSYMQQIKNSSFQDVANEFSQGKVTPLTVSVSLTTLTFLLLISRLMKSPSSGKTSSKKKKPKKRLTKAQKANKTIQGILDHVEKEYVPQIDAYVADPRQYSKEDIQYKYNYFEEMLLKELMKLDGVDVSGNDVLRENRKKVIKFIQDHQKRLDKVKKELDF